jgi:NADPH:quinone reductase-like Zn-dependent oxidoreductase
MWWEIALPNLTYKWRSIMRAMRLTNASGAGVIAEGEMAHPLPGAKDVLIQVHAAGVTPTEVQWYPSTHGKDGQPRIGAVPGHEFSGVIAAVGADVTELGVGDEVFGMNDWFADGAMAEFCLAQPAALARKPARLTHTEAASVPIGALTAWQGLIERAKIRRGETVLVHGGAGAVGIYAVQLAHNRGARVVATVCARNLEFVRELGADRVIDYRSVRFEEQVKDVDVVFDTVGGETLDRSWQVLKPGGRLVTIAADAEGTRDAREQKAFFIVEADGKQLAQIGEMLEQGALRTVVDSVVPFGEARLAYEGRVKDRLGRGKMVVMI